MNICDNSLLRLEAFLNSADKAATRFHDAHVSAQAEGTLAKIEWAKEPAGETWMQRCARTIPNVSQRKIDDTIGGGSLRSPRTLARCPRLSTRSV